MSDTKDEVKVYQWAKGENFGKVVEVLSVDDEFTNFTDGSRIFNNVLPEFLTEVINDELPFPGVDTIGLPSKDAKLTSKPQNPIATVQEVTETKQTEPTNSVLFTLIEKLSNKNFEEIPVKINVNLPKKQVINMLVENSDDSKEDILDAVRDVAINQIEINKLQEFLEIEITNFINKYYE